MIIYTALMRNADSRALDITVKGDHPIGRILAPTWELVWGLKKGSLNELQYESTYLNMIETRFRNNPETFHKLAERDVIIFKCFCKPFEFCHRILIARWFSINLGCKYVGEIDPNLY